MLLKKIAYYFMAMMTVYLFSFLATLGYEKAHFIYREAANDSGLFWLNVFDVSSFWALNVLIAYLVYEILQTFVDRYNSRKNKEQESKKE
jgi:hypothetical protein